MKHTKAQCNKMRLGLGLGVGLGAYGFVSVFQYPGPRLYELHKCFSFFLSSLRWGRWCDISLPSSDRLGAAGIGCFPPPGSDKRPSGQALGSSKGQSC